MEILRVEIPKHIRVVKLSDKQRPQYFEWNGQSIKGKKTKIPVKFFRKGEIRTTTTLIEELKDEFYIGIFKNNKLVSKSISTSELPNFMELQNDYKKYKYRLCSSIDNNPILCNSKSVGTPNMYLIRGQDIYSGNLREHTRGFVMDEIKRYYKKYLEILPVIIDYPVRIECEVHDTIENFYDRTTKDGKLGQPWDIDNYSFPYMKAFPDLLQELGKLKNDDRLHVTGPPAPIFCPISNHEDRKLVFTISKDERDVIKNNETYKNYHKNSYESEDNELVREDDLFEPFKDFGITNKIEIFGTSGISEEDLKEFEKIFYNPESDSHDID